MSPSGYVGIDPGTRALGWAVGGLDRRLFACGASLIGPDAARLETLADCHVRPIRHALGALAMTHGGGARPRPPVFVESMKIATGRRTTPQDLLDVQTVGCLTAALIGPPTLYTPDEWKCPVPKSVHHDRWIGNPEQPGALDAGELAILRRVLTHTRKKNRKEVLDAVGILLYGLGRIERSGAPRRAA